MTLSPDAIKQFIANAANEHPYSEVKTTRNGYCCEWIVLQSRGRHLDVLRVGSGHLYLLPTACIDSGSLQQLLITKAAFPLCNERAKVEDCMSVWGRNASKRWHQLVLNVLCGTEKKSKKELFRLCIQIRMNDLIADRLTQEPVLAHLVRLQWFVAYENFYD